MDATIENLLNALRRALNAIVNRENRLLDKILAAKNPRYRHLRYYGNEKSKYKAAKG